MQIIKYIIYGFILVAIIGYSIYSNLISGLITAISSFKSNFLDFLPAEIRLSFSIIIFGLIVYFVYSFID